MTSLLSYPYYVTSASMIFGGLGRRAKPVTNVSIWARWWQKAVAALVRNDPSQRKIPNAGLYDGPFRELDETPEVDRRWSVKGRVEDH